MKLIKSCMIAFSMYSKVPVPQFKWEDEDMKYVLCFFPFIGVVIGLCLFGWNKICMIFPVGNLAYILTAAAIPILVTGGFHIDGFMDTMDAVHSYQCREKKLEILNDSHIGAFSVIMLVLYYLIYIAAFSEIKSQKQLIAVGIGFVLSRCLSGISVAAFKPAKKDGLLRTFSDSAEKKTVLAVLLVQLALCMAGISLVSLYEGFAVLLGAGGSFVYYRHFVYKEFGGITGDTAGYFLLVCEAAVAAGAALGGRF